jgi:hypothetical protein
VYRLNGGGAKRMSRTPVFGKRPSHVGRVAWVRKCAGQMLLVALAGAFLFFLAAGLLTGLFGGSNPGAQDCSIEAGAAGTTTVCDDGP